MYRLSRPSPVSFCQLGHAAGFCHIRDGGEDDLGVWVFQHGIQIVRVDYLVVEVIGGIKNIQATEAVHGLIVFGPWMFSRRFCNLKICIGKTWLIGVLCMVRINNATQSGGVYVEADSAYAACLTCF